MTTISQVKFWMDGTSATNAEREGADAGTYLSYDVFLGLSVLGGFFGLDHLYLRSPATFLAKFIVNIFCFGIWWIYDATQAVFNADVVRVYGLGLPGWGPFGIGAGVLSKDIPDKKHASFVLYSVALFFGGLIGMDSFVTGDRQMGIIRLLCAISFILLPVSLVIWGANVFNYFTDTEGVIDENYQFFGAPHRSLSNRLRSRFPLIGWLFSPLESIKIAVNNIFGPALIAPITETAKAAMSTVDHVTSTIDNTVKLGQTTIEKSGEIIDKVGQTLETVSQASTMLPAASLYAAAQGSLGQQGGGGTQLQLQSQSQSQSAEGLNKFGYILLATLALLSLSGFVVTVLRTRNGQQQPSTTTAHTQRDDSPPQPGVL